MNLLVFIPVLSIMMVVHELGHFLTARWFGITVQEFGIGLPPRIWGFKRDGVVYSINWIPFGAFVKMLGEEDPTASGSFASKPGWVRAIVLAAGSGMNFVLAIAAFSLAFMVGVPTVTQEGPVRLADIAENSPAQQAGLRAGDLVVSLNGEPIDNSQEFRDLTLQHAGQTIQLVVRRDGAEVSTSLTPRQNPPQGQGSMGVVISANTSIQQFGPLEAIQRGTGQTLQAVGFTFLVPKLIMDGVVDPGDARPIGLPGMAQATGQAVDFAVDTGLWYPLFMIVGIFSAGLSVANMLPIPALDGGRLFFVVLEGVRGRRIAPEREAAVHFVGIVVLLALMVLISVNDIRSPLPEIEWRAR